MHSAGLNVPKPSSYTGPVPTPLSDWLTNNFVSPSELSRVSGIERGRLCDLAKGSRVPTLAQALRIQWATSGGVTVEDWLNVPLVATEWDKLSINCPEIPDLRSYYNREWRKVLNQNQQEKFEANFGPPKRPSEWDTTDTDTRYQTGVVKTPGIVAGVEGAITDD